MNKHKSALNNLGNIDEEIISELNNLGYENIPSYIFHLIKSDILHAISKNGDETKVFKQNVDSSAPLHPETNEKSSCDSIEICRDKRIDLPESSANEITSISTTSSCLSTNITSSRGVTRSKTHSINRKMTENKNTKIGKTKESNSNSSTTKFKRKVLSHVNGNSFIREMEVDMPKSFSSLNLGTPSPNTSKNSSKLYSYPLSDNSSSFTSDSSESCISFRSSSNKSLCKSSKGLPSLPHKKRTDPVAMYSFYKQYWDHFKPPGEKAHDKLRWAVRDRMLDYKL